MSLMVQKMLYKCLCFGDQCAERELSPRSQDFKSSPLTTRSRCLLVHCVFRMYVDKSSNDIQDKRMFGKKVFLFLQMFFALSIYGWNQNSYKLVQFWRNIFVWAVGVAYLSNSMKRCKLKENATWFSSEYRLYIINTTTIFDEVPSAPISNRCLYISVLLCVCARKHWLCKT